MTIVSSGRWLMATAEDRAHAQRLIAIYTENVRRLEEKKARYGSLDVPLAIENAIEQERANIAALEPLTKLQPSARVQEFVKSTTAGEIDLMMLYLQGTQLNARMTKAEEQNQAIIEEQARASISRMQINDRLDQIDGKVTASEFARVAGAWWYRRALLITLCIGLLALCLAFAALIR